MNNKLSERLKSILGLDRVCYYGRAYLMADIIQSRKPNKVVEISEFGCQAAISMAMACQSIDHGHVYFVYTDTICNSYLSNIKEYGVEGRMTTLNMNDTDALCKFDNECIGFLHINNARSCDLSTRTVRNWAPKVNVGGRILVDDVNLDITKEATSLLKTEYGCNHIGDYDIVNEHGQSVGEYALFEKVHRGASWYPV